MLLREKYTALKACITKENRSQICHCNFQLKKEEKGQIKPRGLTSRWKAKQFYKITSITEEHGTFNNEFYEAHIIMIPKKQDSEKS